MKKDRMAERERLQALFQRQPVDRAPFFVQGRAFAAAMTGYSTIDIHQDPEKAFRAQLHTREMFGGMERLPYSPGAFGVREFGGEVEMPTSRYASAVSLKRPAVESEEDALKLEVPDVKAAGTIPLMLRFSRLQEEHGLPITFIAGGVLTTLGYVTGVDRMCRWMIRKPETVHHLCRVVTDFLIAIAEYWVATFGPERLFPYVYSPTESNQIISPKLFREFCLPYLQEIYRKLASLGVRHSYTHICGEQNLNLPHWAEIKLGDPGIVSFGHEVDLDVAAKYFPNDIILGNVEPAVIQAGTPDQVYELSRLCIEKGKKHTSGFILSPGCEMPAKAPPYNVYLMRKAIDDFGWYG